MYCSVEGPSADGVFVLSLTNGENRLNPKSLAAIDGALDQIEAASAGLQQKALIVTGGAGSKYFCNGLDLDFLSEGTPADWTETITKLQALYARLLKFGMVTIASINGHCFAGGAMLALACDYRVMRSDRGFFCLPEVDIGLPFTPGMHHLIASKTTPQALREAAVFGQRISAERAVALGIVDAQDKDFLGVAHKLALKFAPKGRDSATLSAIKAELYKVAIAALIEVAKKPSAKL